MGDDWRTKVIRLAGKGAVMATGPDGKVLISHNKDKVLIPASILKIITAGAALEELGPKYRFSTLFAHTPGGDLLVSGRGDPHLVSEELAQIANALGSRGLREVRNILLDNSFFAPGLVLHGTNRSLNPYDAYNGALCVNFNTINVHVKKNGKIVSAEPQTPLTQLAIRSARKNGVKGKVRINLSESPEQCLMYAGELLKAFLEKQGIAVTGDVKPSNGNPSEFERFYLHKSRRTLEDLLQKMFHYSNNFMANQIFLTMGAIRFGPPATVEKARKVVNSYLKDLGISDIHIEEGSGLSRRTKITAVHMIRVLDSFQPYHNLLDCEGNACFKTGSLHDVKSLAGYLLPETGGPLPFVILLNGEKISRRTRDRLFIMLKDRLAP
jgi:D-alanyl-D-alanine carboxypeptidase/D-alanyl-D-alanine-endopeptidase (penicillin-binding protein 4)